MGIETLKNLAFNVAYEELVRSLRLCQNHPQRGKQFPCLPFSSLLASSRPQLTAQEKSSLVRINLCTYLEGIVSDEMRKKFAERFYQDCFNLKFSKCTNSEDGGHGEHCIIDICSFLDVVLVESFLELKTCVTFPGSEPNPELFSTIVKGSPLLQKLQLDFDSCGTTSMDVVEKRVGSLSSLKHLTHLSLASLDPEIRQTVLSLVGKSCPWLTHLSINGYPHGNQEILSLILGETMSSFFPNADYLRASCYDEKLDGLKVPKDRLTPMCSTLREFNYHGNEWDGKERDAVSYSTVAFALRHLPCLEYFGVARCLGTQGVLATPLGIEKLFNIKAEATAKLESLPTSELQPDSSELVQLKHQISIIPDFLLLTKLDYVDLLNYNLLRAVGAMCPHLKHVVFNAERCEMNRIIRIRFCTDSDSDDSVHSDTSDEYETPTEIGSNLTACFNNWPKLTTIEFRYIIAPIYRSTVLKVFGPNLKNLIFHQISGSDPDMAELTPCDQLESLVFHCFSLITDPKPPTTHLTADTFLPMLKHFKSRPCLGSSWSRLIEEKTSLLSLDVNCCHIGIGDDDTSGASLDQQPSKRLKLNEEVPKALQQLEILNIKHNKGVTPTLLNLFPRLPQLKKVVLSEDVKESSDPVLLNSVMEKLTQQVSPVQIDFVSYNHYDICWELKKKETALQWQRSSSVLHPL